MKPKRFLLLNTDYPAFLDQFYTRHRGLDRCSFDDQITARNATFFGLADGYTLSLRQRGHSAMDLHVNNDRMQLAWARENAEHLASKKKLTPQLRRGYLPWIRLTRDSAWPGDVLQAQITDFDPDVVLNHDITWIHPEHLRQLVGRRVLVGQHAAFPLPDWDYSPYDLILSSWPPTVEGMRQRGIRSERLQLGFDPRVLDVIGRPARDLPLTFVGSLSDIHGPRVRFLEKLSEILPDLSVWTPDAHRLARRSPLRTLSRGTAFGIDMYHVLARSRITLNHHGLEQPYANNMRLYEATGAGALLITDAKVNLTNLFHVGQEILAYNNVDECARIVTSLPEEERTMIAARGQKKTLQSHTWAKRVDEICTYVDELSG